MNGLITTSSLLFGLSAILVVEQKRKEKILWISMLISLILIVYAGGEMINLAFGKSMSAETMLFVASAFYTNIATCFFTIGFSIKTMLWKKKNIRVKKKKSSH